MILGAIPWHSRVTIFAINGYLSAPYQQLGAAPKLHSKFIMLLDYFRKKAKALKREGHSGTLMQCQHVIANQYGFKSWSELINAGEKNLRQAIEMEKHQQEIL